MALRFLVCWILILYPAFFFIMQAGNVVAQNIVETEPHVKLQNGTEGSLPCRFKRQALVVQWSRGPSFSQKELIVAIALSSFDTPLRGGPGYDVGLYNITDDFTLIIYQVNFQYEDQYFCEVVDSQTRRVFENQTTLEVYVLPGEPFPSITNCLHKTTSRMNNQNCTLYEVQSSHNITCTVNGFTPNLMLSLYFRHESLTLTNHSEEEWFNDDRTMGKSVTIMANASYWPYECVALGSVEVNERSATILIRRLPTMPAEEHDRLKEFGYVLILFSVWCIFPVAVFCTMKSGIMRKVLEDIPENIIFIFISMVLAVLPIPFTMIIFGVIYKDDCPAAEEIATYLIVMGSIISFWAVFFLIWIYQNEVKENITDGSFSKFISCCLSIITGCEILSFFVAGHVWMFRIYPPNMSDPTSLEYCHPTLYYFSIVVTDTYVLVVVFFTSLYSCAAAYVIYEDFT